MDESEHEDGVLVSVILGSGRLSGDMAERGSWVTVSIECCGCCWCCCCGGGGFLA